MNPVVIGNPIECRFFEGETIKENAYSCIYSSNYSRGLEDLLDRWPAVKEQYPKATLDIYYGWRTWVTPSEGWKEKMQQKLQVLQEYGVKEHGCVGHRELAAAFMRASFILYPCNMDETFCITMMRARLAGAVPVVIERAALKETVRYGFRCAHLDDFVNTALLALSQADELDEMRQEMRRYVIESFSCEVIAKKWSDLVERAYPGATVKPTLQ